MPYASFDDLVEQFTAQEVESLSDGDDERVNRALSDASATADSYIAIKYPLPLPDTPTALLGAVCDIARYRLYKDRATEEVRKRYEDAIGWLKRIADNKAVLVFDPSVVPAEERAALQADTNPIGATYTGGVFSNEMLDKML